MKKLLLPALLFCHVLVKAQSDLLVMKQRGRPVQTWVKGSFFNFQFVNKQWIQGRIREMRNDSLLIDVMVFRSVLTRFGVPAIDTGRVGILKFHVREVYAMPKRRLQSGAFSDGALLQVGSGGFIFLNIFNSLTHGEAVFGGNNPSALGIAAGIFGIGTLISLTHKDYVVLGKKFSLEIMHGGG
ncbi:MAG: hypothetical protein JO301_03960 [Chitinophagaceae bacterium]|nr:hypothetical protein [Chitinophagaceae bacterium]